MKKNKLTLCVVFLLPVVSLACSLFTNTPGATATPESNFNFRPVTDPLVIEPASLPEAQADVMYDIEVRITQNVTPVGGMFIKEGALPAGLEFVFLKGEDAAKISGVPKETGIFHITIAAWCFGTMVSGQALEKEYQIVVNE